MPRRSQSPQRKPIALPVAMPIAMPKRELNTVPATTNQLQPTPQVSGWPSILQTMKEGLAFGVGNAIAHRLIMGNSLQQQHKPEKVAVKLNPEYERCIERYNDKSLCEELYLDK